MTGTDLATNTNPDVPTLIELIDRSSSFGAGALVAFARADFVAMRAAAVAIETEYAIARAEISEKAKEYLEVHRDLQNLGDLYDLESREADDYAKKMHAAHEVVAAIWELLAKNNIAIPTDLPVDLQEKISTVMVRSLPMKGSSPKPTTFITEEVAPLVSLES